MNRALTKCTRLYIAFKKWRGDTPATSLYAATWGAKKDSCPSATDFPYATGLRAPLADRWASCSLFRNLFTYKQPTVLLFSNELRSQWRLIKEAIKQVGVTKIGQVCVCRFKL